MKTLNELIDELENLIPQNKKSATKISSVSAGWHMAHSFMVLKRMSNALCQSDPAQFVPSPFNIQKFIVTLTGRIPRGRGKAPAAVQPTDDADASILHDLCTKAKTALAAIETLPANAFFDHPVFGILNKKQTIHFMQIHTNHHLKIVKDIVKG